MLLSAKAISLLALASLVASRPSPHLVRLDLVARDVVLSPDNSCGGTNNYTCPDNACCSASGWCGTTIDYCVDGCQADFGTCAGSGDYAGTVSPDNSCGGTNGFICPTGSCCSANGWCGNTTDYCGTGCQSDFGSCSAVASGTASAGAPAASGGTSPDGTCGPSNNGYTCPTGECCSGAGYCGSTSDYCASPGCLSGYGDCDADTIPAGTNTSSVIRTLFGDVPYGSIIEDCHDAGNIALTFDDGPYTYTSDLLDLLANHSAKATFFITGNNNGKGEIDLYWADVIKKAYAAGHQIASHSWSHANFDELAPYQMRNELYKNEIALVSIIGKFPTYFRPPYSACGDACLAVMEELGYHAVLFDLDTQDYLHTSADTIQLSKDAVYDQMNGLDVSETDMLSIAHDIHWQTVYNLTGYMLEYMQGLGYNFVTVGECLQDPEEYWYRSAEDGTVSVSSEAPSSSSEAPSAASSASASVSSSFLSSESSSSFLSSASSSLDSSESPSSYSTLPPTSSSIPAAPSSTPSTLSTSTISSSPASSSAVSTPAPITSSSILSSSASSSSISITTSPTSSTTSSSGHHHTV